MKNNQPKMIYRGVTYYQGEKPFGKISPKKWIYRGVEFVRNEVNTHLHNENVKKTYRGFALN